jgi:hypothetical protein
VTAGAALGPVTTITPLPSARSTRASQEPRSRPPGPTAMRPMAVLVATGSAGCWPAGWQTALAEVAHCPWPPSVLVSPDVRTARQVQGPRLAGQASVSGRESGERDSSGAGEGVLERGG